MEELLRILDEIDPSIDYANVTDLIDGKRLDSFEIVTLVTEISDAFGIEVTAKWMEAENFNSVDAIWNMIQKIKEED
ncbi:MAG: acyl carrier protein [Parasporobacterium sp.]|nr:acyl carrier protein [Parasporobacterium sp.]